MIDNAPKPKNKRRTNIPEVSKEKLDERVRLHKEELAKEQAKTLFEVFVEQRIQMTQRTVDYLEVDVAYEQFKCWYSESGNHDKFQFGKTEFVTEIRKLIGPPLESKWHGFVIKQKSIQFKNDS